MREVFLVDSIDEERVNLISTRSSSCESCSLNGACNLTGGNNERTMKIKKKEFDEIPSIGDYVIVEIPDFSISKISFIIYGFPLLSFLILLLIAYYITKNDIQSFIVGLFGMSGAYGIIAYLDRTVFKKKYNPKVIKILPKQKNIHVELGILK
ncbi:positive regulator of sigma(E), RseC/MucC [Marinitoga hydrogenitolerans DSM 16785]|uniref:Positive regulator of sigma(E), RseC/MucC n=1 Tax=Marinitoga hydrogenitolerans (strain DSM 16785 / JCM 12826 / AT1271) TaxID=1122195 RepID=A0A1M4Y045_MARH1|nr:SoxR reducing system RseC family protein [Marinitoga hydrogenitolerans]SHE99058.1 positive regulator of sigma(E), RseC/MucC [Marinitoga hydrogenitolerans DSM 16785]